MWLVITIIQIIITITITITITQLQKLINKNANHLNCLCKPVKSCNLYLHKNESIRSLLKKKETEIKTSRIFKMHLRIGTRFGDIVVCIAFADQRLGRRRFGFGRYWQRRLIHWKIFDRQVFSHCNKKKARVCNTGYQTAARFVSSKPFFFLKTKKKKCFVKTRLQTPKSPF